MQIEEKFFETLEDYAKYCRETPFNKLPDIVNIFIKDEYICSIERFMEEVPLYAVPLGLDFADDVKVVGKVQDLPDIFAIASEPDRNSKKKILEILEKYGIFTPAEKLPQCSHCEDLDQLRVFYFNKFDLDRTTTFDFIMFEGTLFRERVYMFKGVHLLPSSYNIDFINKKSPNASKVRGDWATFVTWVTPVG